MNKLLVALIVAGSATAAGAQLLGGSIGAGANVGVGAPVGAIGSAARGTGSAVDSTVRGTTDAVGDTARDTGVAAHDAPRNASRATDVKVRAGASTRVDRGTRCYDDGGYWDPYYRDGYYYCETRTGPGVAASAKVKTGG